MSTAVALFQPGVADWEAGTVLPLLRSTFGFHIVIATPDGRSVESIGGVRMDGDASFDTVNYRDAALLLLIGSDAWARQPDPVLTQRLKARAEAGMPIAAICGATYAVAQAGLLDDRAHTSNSLDFLKSAAGYGGEARYRDVPHAVTDRGLVTAPGTAPLSFACAAALLVLPDRRAEIEGFWNMVRKEGEALGASLDAAA